MSFLNFFRRKKGDPEKARRAHLLKRGRIAEGRILDVSGDDKTGVITHIYYQYEISGVEYESSQSLDEEQQLRSVDYAPGAKITVRYNPHQPGNSVVT